LITVAEPKSAVRRASLTVLVVLAALSVGVSFAGCSRPSDEGTLDGTLQAVGGPAAIAPRPLSGSVTFHGSDGNIATIDVSSNGRFSAHLPVGRYTIEGRSPQFNRAAGECQAPGPVNVTNDVTSRVEVDCQEG
jgi:hypothetical protein